MSYLTLNGIPITIIDWSRNSDNIGGNARAYTGGMLSARRARKRSWQITTYPLQQGEAEAVEALACALGDTWSFDTDLYSGKGAYMLDVGGDIPSGDALAFSRSTAEAKYGAASLTLTGDGATADPACHSSHGASVTPGQAYTVFGWVYSALTSGQVTVNSYELDAAGAYLRGAPCSYAANDSAWHFVSGTRTAGSDAATAVVGARGTGSPDGDAYFDDLTIIPAELTTAQLAAIEAAGVAFTPPPAVRLEGDIVGSEIVACRGTLNASRGTHYGDETGARDGEVLTFTLEEQ